LTIVFFAKKGAEIAPRVGLETDVYAIIGLVSRFPKFVAEVPGQPCQNPKPKCFILNDLFRGAKAPRFHRKGGLGLDELCQELCRQDTRAKAGILWSGESSRSRLFLGKKPVFDCGLDYTKPTLALNCGQLQAIPTPRTRISDG
jgi:hypothetical protein